VIRSVLGFTEPLLWRSASSMFLTIMITDVFFSCAFSCIRRGQRVHVRRIKAHAVDQTRSTFSKVFDFQSSKVMPSEFIRRGRNSLLNFCDKVGVILDLKFKFRCTFRPAFLAYPSQSHRLNFSAAGMHLRKCVITRLVCFLKNIVVLLSCLSTNMLSQFHRCTATCILNY
jgi:hypothetical protein